MNSFRLLLVAMSIAIVVVTVAAATELGLPAAGSTFLHDLHHPWRMQFYSDLEIHLLLAAFWMIYRDQFRRVGIACGLAAPVLGALFTAPYILIASLRARGDVAALLIGTHRVAANAVAQDARPPRPRTAS